ncbi:carbohydrate ABC transporter permease [Cohnella sp. REN36]|uniref:carbohydrate ABC transporter permease n=1 Tax=Cohnella sp. REN36 TaxID=2887347 RepID=UPI001D1399B8|nr:carbohydrate ABC transporter permease [Cohnella sp. REN36]MCC3372320.1 carbohydrate ABC transporter permease [Cohnella sp. REN36]
MRVSHGFPSTKWQLVKHYAILTAVSVIVLFPFYWMFVTSVKPPEDILRTPPNWWPTAMEVVNYVKIWTTIPLFIYLKNSLLYAALSTALCVVLSGFAAYSLSRFRFKLRKLSIMAFLTSQLVPGTLTIIPFYFMMYNMGLNNTVIGIVLAYSIWAVPFCTLMLRGYLASAIPVSLEESATIDGCNKLGIFFRIALPISLPGIVATAIFSFILAWNEFMWASIILTKSGYKPLSVGMYDYIGKTGVTPAISLYMATAVIATIPSLIVFGIAQKHLVNGLTAGAVKG